MRDVSTIHMSADLRARTDLTEFYDKTPQQMSRYEIADLEKELRILIDPTLAAKDDD